MKTTRTIKVIVHDPVHSEIDNDRDMVLVLPAFGYNVRGWRDTRNGNVSVSRQKFLFGPGRQFYTGLLPRLRQFCKSRNYAIEEHVIWQENIEPIVEPVFDGLTVRNDQKRLIHDFVSAGCRGVLVAPTRTGKSVVMFSLVKGWPYRRFLILAHTAGIVMQHYDDALRFGFTRTGLIGAGSLDKNLSPLTIATWQSFVKLKPQDYADYFDGVIVDEAHHITSERGNYVKILERLLCPIRCGMTATLPSEQKERLVLEGLIGPVVGELTMKEAVTLNIISKPVVLISKVPDNTKIKEIKGYKGAYREGIVRNKAFARMVLQDALKYVKDGKSVLIFVTEIEHGKKLSEMARNIFDTDVPFIYSGSELQQRNEIRKAMNSEPIAAIATACWREGITIPNLAAIINAAGGKKELVTLQAVGRGLGKTSTKDTVHIHDYFNPNSVHFISHFGERLCLYMANKWLAGQERFEQ